MIHLEADKMIGGPYKYLVTICEDFVSGVQIASNEYVSDIFTLKDVDSIRASDYEWWDDRGDLVLGIISSKDFNEAINSLSEKYNIDKRALHIYELK